MPASRTTLDTPQPVDDAACIAASIMQPEAFRTLFERHHDRVRRYVVSRVGPRSADDIVAESFVAAFQARERFTAGYGTDALPWLLGVATNVLARHRAAERRWLSQGVAASIDRDQPAAFEADAVERADAERSHKQLARALKQLPSREREPFLLHAVGGLSYEEVAAALAVPIGTVRSRISRGRTRLAAWMEAER